MTNDGSTILSALVKDGNATNAVIIYPGDSFIIPKGWTNIVVANISTTNSGSFQLFLK